MTLADFVYTVLLKPRLERQTLLLWAVPPLVLMAGALALWIKARRRATSAIAQPPLTSEEAAQLAQLVTGAAEADGQHPSKTL